MRRVAFVVAGAMLVGARFGTLGCNDSGSHIYAGAAYDPTLGCLDPLTSVDVVTGPEPMTPCGPVCIVAPPEDGGQAVYVSTMCAPYPGYPNVVEPATNPLCVPALAAFHRDALCIDGGVVLPPQPDAGPDAASLDAGVDAPADAAEDATIADAGAE
jgi:hypothetical protein